MSIAGPPTCDHGLHLDAAGVLTGTGVVVVEVGAVMSPAAAPRKAVQPSQVTGSGRLRDPFIHAGRDRRSPRGGPSQGAT